jgi:hypothetical protein
MDAISSAFSGIQAATAQFNSATQRIAGGELEVEPIVESKIASTGIKANLKALEASLEIQETALDILA